MNTLSTVLKSSVISGTSPTSFIIQLPLEDAIANVKAIKPINMDYDWLGIHRQLGDAVFEGEPFMASHTYKQYKYNTRGFTIDVNGYSPVINTNIDPYPSRKIFANLPDFGFFLVRQPGPRTLTYEIEYTDDSIKSEKETFDLVRPRFQVTVEFFSGDVLQCSILSLPPKQDRGIPIKLLLLGVSTGVQEINVMKGLKYAGKISYTFSAIGINPAKKKKEWTARFALICRKEKTRGYLFDETNRIFFFQAESEETKKKEELQSVIKSPKVQDNNPTNFSLSEERMEDERWDDIESTNGPSGAQDIIPTNNSLSENGRKNNEIWEDIESIIGPSGAQNTNLDILPSYEQRRGEYNESEIRSMQPVDNNLAAVPPSEDDIWKEIEQLVGPPRPVENFH